MIHYRFGPGGGMDAHYADLVRGFSDKADVLDLWVYERSPRFSVPDHVNVRVVERGRVWSALRKTSFYTKIVRDLKMSDYDLVIGTMPVGKQHIIINGGTHIGYVRGVYKKFRITDFLPIIFERRSFRRSKMVIAHSRKIAGDMEHHYGIPKDKIHVLYPPTDSRRFNPQVREANPEFRKNYGISPDKFSVFFPSTNHEIKGLRPLLEAFSRLPKERFELFVAGAPMDADALPENVKYLGYVSKTEELYAACDVTILPSHYDGFGLVVVESIACGTPVIVSRNSGASEIVDSDHGVVLENVTADEIEAGIIAASTRKFALDPNFLETHGLMIDQYVDKILALAGPILRESKAVDRDR
ncbi:MAG: glycosyltransferase family 4 protein [Oligoflexia bacterium]|nr:glycosyltransferase family 4 protein [Oligoflexia bacterium]